ncbi:MAG: ABC transporter ATP-binding protein [Deltaproteobacteria bacterium]|nr:ABC transporter ATP-binding protein [Deltaproteobacteria bacterium]
MIEVRQLTKRFGPITAVDDVSFSVGKGEVLGFLGPNGAGKSTTIRMIAGFLPQTAGTILINGQDINENSIVSKSLIGYMPESTPLYKDMTAKEYLEFIAEIHGVADVRQRVEEVIRIANLDAISNQLIETISKGYRSRLNFAASIIHDPPILLLDEPTDGLDPNQKNEIRKIITSLSRDKAIVVSTHILEEVEAMCSRVIIISEGSVVLDGPPSELRAKTDNNHKVVVSLNSDDKERAEQSLAAVLTRLGAPADGFERFRVETDEALAAVSRRLGEAGIAFEEIFYFDAPLDEAFSRLTRTNE